MMHFVVTWELRLFQIFGPTCEKARSPQLWWYNTEFQFGIEEIVSVDSRWSGTRDVLDNNAAWYRFWCYSLYCYNRNEPRVFCLFLFVYLFEINVCLLFLYVFFTYVFWSPSDLLGWCQPRVKINCFNS